MQKGKTYGFHMVLSIGFLVMLTLPFLGIWLGLPQIIPINENRKLASAPKIDLTYLDPLPNQVNDWFSDHFYGRSILMNAFDTFQSWTGEINAAPNKVIIGKEGWVFLNEKPMDQYLGKNLFSNEELRNIFHQQIQRKKWLNERGISYYLIIAPNKQSIYPEFLPDYFQRENVTTQLDQLAELFAQDTSFRFLDLRQILKSKKRDNLLYQLTDTHWNDLGAFYSYQAIARLLKKDFSRIEPVSLEENTQRRSSNQLGNLARMARLSDKYSEAIPLLQPKNPKTWLEGRVSSDSVSSIYPQFRVTAEIRNSGNKDLPKLLVVRDSYTTYMIPWLSSHFGTSVYLWDNWQYELHENIIEAEKPDAVMVIMLEEYLEKLKL